MGTPLPNKKIKKTAKCLRNIFDALPFVYCLCHLVTCMEDLEIQSVSTILPDKPRDQVDTHVD